MTHGNGHSYEFPGVTDLGLAHFTPGLTSVEYLLKPAAIPPLWTIQRLLGVARTSPGPSSWASVDCIEISTFWSTVTRTGSRRTRGGREISPIAIPMVGFQRSNSGTVRRSLGMLAG